MAAHTREAGEISEVEIDPSLLIPIEGSLVELDWSVLEAEATGTFTSPFWLPEPAAEAVLPPPPRLPTLSGLPSLRPPPALPPPPSLPSSASLPSLPPVPSLPLQSRPLLPAPPALPPLPSLPLQSRPSALPPIPTPPPPSASSERPPSRPAWLDAEPPSRARPRAYPTAREYELTQPSAPPRPTKAAPDAAARRRTLFDPVDPSLRPAAWSIPAPAPRSRTKKLGARAAGLGIGAGVLLFACAWLVATPSAASATARGVITVTDSQGIALRAVHVHVDGLLSCETTPCSVDLEPGAHHVDVLNLLTDQRSGRSLNLAKGETATLHFALPSEPTERRAASQGQPPAPARAAEADEPISVTSLAQEPAAQVVENPTKPQPAPLSPPKSTGGAFLNLNSIPISSVVIDGRPVGSTPLVGVQVSPGTHMVTFVHPTFGRRSANIEATFGQRKAVVVRFKKSLSPAE